MNARERVDARVAALRRSVPEVEVEACAAHLAQGARLLDVREPDEVAQGSPVGALRLPRAFLELRIGEVAPEVERPLLVLLISICSPLVPSSFLSAVLNPPGSGASARMRRPGRLVAISPPVHA